MRFAVVVFPGTWSDGDCYYVLEHDTRPAGGLRLAPAARPLGLRLHRILPGGFSYGDYLRAGAIARFSPVMEAVARHAERGGLVSRHLQRLPDPVRGRTPSRRPHAQR